MTIFNFGFLNPFANGAPSNEIEAFPDENRGLGIAFDQTEGKPEMKGLNGLFNKITQSLLSIKQNGLIGWTNDIEYIAGGFTVENGKLYQAIRNNTNKQPSLSQSDWALWSPISSISVSTNGNLKRTTDANGVMTLEVLTANDTQRGAVRAATATEVANKSNVNAYVTPKNVQDMFNGGFGTNDSLTLPSGHILQWGIGSGGDGYQVNFPKAFPNRCLVVSVTDKDGLASHGYNHATMTNSKFNIRSTATLSFSWFAIGY